MVRITVAQGWEICLSGAWICMAVNKIVCCVLHLSRTTTVKQDRYGEEWLENFSTEKNLGMLVDSQLNIRQWCGT